MKFLISFSLLLSSAFSFASAPKFTYKLLSQIREDIKLPEYSLAEKKLVLGQVKLVLNEIFAHKDLKIEHFGFDAFPMPVILELEKNLETVSDQEFHRTVGFAFQKLRDWHTTYQMPKPYSCYRSLLPFSFRQFKNTEGKTAMAVEVVLNQNVLDILPNTLKVSPGDVLVSYNGVDALEALKPFHYQSRGANEAAVLINSVELLTWRSQKYDLLPESDFETMVLRNPLLGEYSIKVPWLIRYEESCLKPGTDKVLESGANDFTQEFHETFKTHKKSVLKSFSNERDLISTKEPILKYKIIKNEFGHFGYITLSSFVPEELDAYGVILEVQKLLLNELAQTKGIIFDVRNNGGGQISLGEYMVQLFTPKDLLPLGFRLMNSEALRHYFSFYNMNPYFGALEEAQRLNLPYTLPLALNSKVLMNSLSQSYFGPVAVFNNASCYSTCDMFSSLMQDFGVATIFGEDTTTGAGGANNTNLESLYLDMPEGDKGPFALLPSGQNIGFSFRQTLRVGKHQGEYLEDIGVEADIILPATHKDVLSDSAVQLKSITKYLRGESSKYNSSVQFSNEVIDVVMGERPKFASSWSNTDKIEFKMNGLSVEVREVSLHSERQLVLPEVFDTFSYRAQVVEVLGYLGEKRVWKKKLTYRVVPLPTQIVSGDDYHVKLAPEDKALALYGDLNGWNFLNGKLQIGNGSQYLNDVTTHASVFLELPSDVEYELKYKALIQTEEDFDFFSVSIIEENNKSTVLSYLSGRPEQTEFNYELERFKGKKIEIRFTFTSDGGLTDLGVLLEKISVEKI